MLKRVKTSRSEVSKMSLCSNIITICDGKADGSSTLCKRNSHAAFPSPSLMLLAHAQRDIMKVTLLGKVFRRKCAHFPENSIGKMRAFSSNLHKMHAFSLEMHAFYWKCAHFPNLNFLRFRRPINIGLSYIYERPIKSDGQAIYNNVFGVIIHMVYSHSIF